MAFNCVFELHIILHTFGMGWKWVPLMDASKEKRVAFLTIDFSDQKIIIRAAPSIIPVNVRKFPELRTEIIRSSLMVNFEHMIQFQLIHTILNF